jgi:pimeloyl-ACP methyl ester carboxylesterase
MMSELIEINSIDALWLTVTPSLSCFDQPLLKQLSKTKVIANWQYRYGLDEGGCLDNAIEMLNLYLTDREDPIHLIGHGMGGTLALLFSQRYPDKVRSLTIMGVAEQPAVTWHAYYYVQRQTFSCSPQQILVRLVRNLLGDTLPHPIGHLVAALRKDLEQGLSPHSVLKIGAIPQGGVAMPLLICSATEDPIVHLSAVVDWNKWLKPQDELFWVSGKMHFFHYFYPERLSNQIQKFWQESSSQVPQSILAYREIR